MKLPEPPLLDAEHQPTLLGIAQDAIREALAGKQQLLPDLDAYHPDLREHTATFVTLERDGQLLGCVGALQAVRPLAEDVAYNALSAAFADPRVPAVTRDDFVAMSIKVSLLSPPELLTAGSYAEVVSAVRPGLDGLILEAPDRRSTLLPSVWPKVRDVDEFLSVLWRKAGIPPRRWASGTLVSRYATTEFGDPGPRSL